MIHVAGWSSEIQTQMEFSVGMIIRDGLRIKTCVIKSKGQNKAEGKFKLDHWPDVILADPTRALDEGGPSQLS